MSMRLRLGYSPCPNDTFAFYALQAGLIPGAGASQPAALRLGPSSSDPEIEFDTVLMDIDALNAAAVRGELDVAKVSYHAYGHLAEEWVLLRSGGALGHGVGPLVVARRQMTDVRGARIAVPGGTTTAKLLLSAWAGELDTVVIRYDEIMPRVAAGEFDAGLIIHESRFTYQRHGLVSLVDLGAWWEEETGHPVPLGAIAAHRQLGSPLLARLDALVRASVVHALSHPDTSERYVAEHAQEMEPEVRRKHIELYVNEHTVDVGPAGEAAVRELLRRGSWLGLFPVVSREPFVPEPPVRSPLAGRGSA